MNRTRLLILSLALNSASASLWAREAQLIDFTAAVTSEPRADAPAAPNLDDEPDPLVNRSSPEFGMWREIAAPQVRAFFRTGPAPDRPQSGQSALAGPGASGHWRQDCPTGRYAPAWWNPPAAEQRRAVYFTLIGHVACEFGLPHRFLDAVIAQESGFNSNAVSKAGAAGMMQIMPATARSLGLSNPFDPIANLRAGARYLRQQLDRFGRYDLALAAYNAGPERRSLQRGAVPAIAETRNYVRTILTNWGRLITLDHGPPVTEPNRGELAAQAVRASGYRELQIARYDQSYQDPSL